MNDAKSLPKEADLACSFWNSRFKKERKRKTKKTAADDIATTGTPPPSKRSSRMWGKSKILPVVVFASQRRV
jgi:hypothetical protein